MSAERPLLPRALSQLSAETVAESNCDHKSFFETFGGPEFEPVEFRIRWLDRVFTGVRCFYTRAIRRRDAAQLVVSGQEPENPVESVSSLSVPFFFSMPTYDCGMEAISDQCRGFAVQPSMWYFARFDHSAVCRLTTVAAATDTA